MRSLAIFLHVRGCGIVVQLHSQSLRLDSGRSYTRCTGSVRFQPNINSAGVHFVVSCVALL